MHRLQATGHWWRVPQTANAPDAISNHAEQTSSPAVNPGHERLGHSERHPLAIAALQVSAHITRQ